MICSVTDKPKTKRPQQVYTLLVEVGRSDNDGLPKGSSGAALMCYASGVDEAEAGRENESVFSSRVSPENRRPCLPLFIHQ